MDVFDCLLQHLVHAILCIQYLHCYVINYHYIFSGKNGLKMIISQLFLRQYIGQQKVVIVPKCQIIKKTLVNHYKKQNVTYKVKFMRLNIQNYDT